MHRRSFLASLFAPFAARFVPGHTIKASQIKAGTINHGSLVRAGLMSANEFRLAMGFEVAEVARVFNVPPRRVMPGEFPTTYGAAWEALHPTLRSPV